MVSLVDTRDAWIRVKDLVARGEDWFSVDGVAGYGLDFEHLGGEEEAC